MTENKTSSRRRIIIAVTESSSLSELWRAAMQSLDEAHAEVVALFLHDERWHRAASLPFTREVSRAGGESTDFTAQRAEQLHAETVASLRKKVDELAAEANLKIEFESLPESEISRSRSVTQDTENVLIAPAVLTKHPVVTELKQLNLRILFVGSVE